VKLIIVLFIEVGPETVNVVVFNRLIVPVVAVILPIVAFVLTTRLPNILTLDPEILTIPCVPTPVGIPPVILIVPPEVGVIPEIRSIEPPTPLVPFDPSINNELAVAALGLLITWGMFNVVADIYLKKSQNLFKEYF
jgi:hypothetical protein